MISSAELSAEFEGLSQSSTGLLDVFDLTGACAASVTATVAAALPGAHAGISTLAASPDGIFPSIHRRAVVGVAVASVKVEAL
jgi:hypothetical protein